MTSAALPFQSPTTDLFQVIRCPVCKKVNFGSAPTCFACGSYLAGGPSALASRSLDGHIQFHEWDAKFYQRPPALKKPKITAAEVIRQGPIERLEENRNWFCIICGEPGTGKSWGALRISEMVQPGFQADQVAFTKKDCLDLIDCCTAGEIILYDEAEEWNARRSMGKDNVDMGEITSMMRFTRVSIVFTLPSARMIDVNARRLMHNYLITRPINRKRCPPWQKNKTAIDWFDVKRRTLPQGSDDQEIYYQRPIVKKYNEKGRVVGKERCGTIFFLAPSDPTLIEEYETEKERVFRGKMAKARREEQARSDTVSPPPSSPTPSTPPTPPRRPRRSRSTAQRPPSPTRHSRESAISEILSQG